METVKRAYLKSPETEPTRPSLREPKPESPTNAGSEAQSKPVARCADGGAEWCGGKESVDGDIGAGDLAEPSARRRYGASAAPRHDAESELRGQKTFDVALMELGEELEGLRLRCPRVEEELSRSLSRLGQLTPVLVFEHRGELELIDGFKRLRAARGLGWSGLRAEAIDVDAVGAKLRLMQSNVRSGLHALEEAWLVRALYRQDGLTQPQIAALMSRDKSWVSRRLILAEGLSEEVEGAMRLGLLTATAARELGRLPRGNQADAAGVVTRSGLTSRQTASLVDRLLAAGDEGSRQRLLTEASEGKSANPERPARRGAAGRSPGEWIVADAAAVTRLGARLSARLLERPLWILGDDAAGIAAEALRTLRPSLRALGEVVDRSLSRLEDGR